MSSLKDLITIKDLTREDILSLIKEATARKANPIIMDSKKEKIASLFFENSTRTRVSSEAAAINLGYEITGFSGSEGTSVKKGEPLLDTVKMFEGYGVKAAIIRHPLAGASRFVGDNVKIPIINAGDGSNGHPTQTLLDLFTIFESQGKLDGLHIALVGDLKYGRTVHSLLQAMEIFDVKVTLIAPENLKMPNWRVDDYEYSTKKEISYSKKITDVIEDIDVLYMTRIQRERFPAGIEGEIEFNKIARNFILYKEDLANCKKSLTILHPLPRDKKNIEIHPDVDQTPYAAYFRQAQNGLYMREAIISSLLSGKIKGKTKIEDKTSDFFSPLEVTDGNKIGESLVYRLDSGILIDHIDAGKGHQVYNILKLQDLTDKEVVICTNIRSKKQGRKDVLAIHDVDLSPEQLYKISLISPDHTINYIENRIVYKKGKTILPSILKDHLICKNERCISRKEHQEYCSSHFYVESQHPLKVRCHHCELIKLGDEIEVH